MNIKICNFCEKEFDTDDYVNGGQIIDNLSGMKDFDMCQDCYHKIMKILLPRCKIKPFEAEWEDEDDENYDEDVN